MGTRLLKTWRQIHGNDGPTGLDAFASTELTLPVAFGLVCASAGVDERAALEAFMYTRLAATVSCAMRAMSIGQHEAHGLLADALADVPAAAERVLASGRRPNTWTPASVVQRTADQHSTS